MKYICGRSNAHDLIHRAQYYTMGYCLVGKVLEMVENGGSQVVVGLGRKFNVYKREGDTITKKETDVRQPPFYPILLPPPFTKTPSKKSPSQFYHMLSQNPI